MKKLNIKNYFILVALLCLSGCSTQKLYNFAIDYERGRADLSIRHIELDFGRVVYLENAVVSDTAIILLHGFGGEKDNWNRFSAQLKVNMRIIIPDLPGHGESVSNEDLDYSISHQAKLLSNFVNVLDIKKIHIVGNSMGGAIAIRYVVLNPAKVKSLTLVDSLGLKKTASELDVTIQGSKTNPMLNICSEEAFNTLLSFGMENPPYIPGMFMDMLVAKKCERSNIENIIYADMLQDSSLNDVTPKIDVPTLIIWGRKDRILHVDNAQLFHDEINNSKMVIFEEAGHVPILEIPQKTANVVGQFISKIE